MKGAYYKTKESVEEYIRLAKGVNGKQLIEKMKCVLPKDSEVLEIGTGPGSDWELLSKTYQVTGSDNSDEFLNYLKDQYPKGEFLQLDATTIETSKKFDGIYSNKVLHHLKDNELEMSVKRQCETLHTNGIICHSFWKGNGSEIFKGLFVNYHSAKSLEDFFKEHFKILSIEAYNEFEDGDSLLLIGKKL